MATGTSRPAEAEIERKWNERDDSEYVKSMLFRLTKMNPEDSIYYEHGELFNWFTDPLRTGDEFYHIINSVAPTVFKAAEYGRRTVGNERRPKKCCFISLGKVAAEALAVKSPVLEGFWEQVAWAVVRLGRSYSYNFFGFVSERLSEWIIEILANSGQCPNSNLRVQFMILLKNMVQLDNHHAVLHLKTTRAFESVISACQGLSVDFFINKRSGETGFQTQNYPRWAPGFDSNGSLVINISDISSFLESFDKTRGINIIFPLDKKYSEELIKVKNLRLSALLHDVSYTRGLNPSKYEEPKMLPSLLALIKFTGRYAREILKIFKGKQYEDWQIDEIAFVTKILLWLIENLDRSCQTPQLITFTTSCVMDVLEAVLICNVNETQTNKEIKRMDLVLRPRPAHIPLRQEILKCVVRLKHIQDSWYHYRSDTNCSLREFLENSNGPYCPNICKIVFND